MATDLRGPIRGDVGVIALVVEPWSMYWSTRHHVLTRLAQHFRVLWMSPPHDWRESHRRLMLGAPSIERIGTPGFVVYRPEVWLPQLYRPGWLAGALFRERLRRARTYLRGRGCTTIVLYLWHPTFAPALHAVAHDLSCYHIDDEYSFSEIEHPVDPAERTLIATVDQVFVHSRAMMEKKGSINPHTMLTPNGVDYAAFASPFPEPYDLAAIPHPRIGYTGFIKKQLDWQLLIELAMRHPAWSFVFVGKQRPHPDITPLIDRMTALPNVYFLGQRITPDLARYPQHFDVCIMPYRATAYANYIYPLKLHEYLASGRPTVGTRIRSLEEFSHVVVLAAGVDEWSGAIAAALDPVANAPDRREARQAEARRYDWQLLVADVAECIAHRLAERATARVHDPPAA